MKYVSVLVGFLLCGFVFAAPPSAMVTATGTFYFEMDMGSEAKAVDVNFAFFVPDAASLSKFPAVTSGQYAAPVRYISFEPASKALEAVVGKETAHRLSRGDMPVIKIPVTLTLRNFRSEIECDSRVYYATLVSVKSWHQFYAVTSKEMPGGC